MLKLFRKRALLIAFLSVFVCMASHAQSKYLDKNGELIFEASEALFEEVKAKNESVTAVLNTENNEFAALALMKGFRFKNSLMEEHFNENYIESETYPKAIFKGKIQELIPAELSEKSKHHVIKGSLEVHGVKKELQTTVHIQKVGTTISITGGFEVAPSDFDIEIPSIVRNKIAKTVQIRFDFKLTLKP